MNRRMIAILVIVIGFLILAAVGVVYINQLGSPPTAEVTPGAAADVPPGDADAPPADIGLPPGVEPGQPLPEMVEVVVSLQTVPRGWLLTEAELHTDMRLASEVGSNVITKIEDAVGLYARTDIFQGETLTFDMLVNDPTILGQNEYGPSSLIPPGFVAAAVPMDRLSSVGYALAPGDSIDIMISFYFYQIDEQFQTLLQNSAVFFLEDVVAQAEEAAAATTTPEAQTTNQSIVVISPYGRFEELPTGDLVHVGPAEAQRPVLVSMILQNAKIIQVGAWVPTDAVLGPTPTPTPIPQGVEVTPTVGPFPTNTPAPPDVLLVALSPQQQLFLKYAVESDAKIDYALRGVQDGQLYSVENVDISFLLRQFNIEVPPNYGFTIDKGPDVQKVTPTPGNLPPASTTGENS